MRNKYNDIFIKGKSVILYLLKEISNKDRDKRSKAILKTTFLLILNLAIKLTFPEHAQ